MKQSSCNFHRPGRSILMAGPSLFLTLLLAAPLAVHAQNAPPPPPSNGPGSMNNMPMQGGMPGGMRGRMDPERQLRHLTRVLNLSSAQQQAVLPILKDRARQMESLRKDQTFSRQARRQQMMSIQSTTQDRIKAVLNDTQKKQYDEMLSQQRKRMQERMQRWNGPRPGGPQGPPPGNNGQGPQ